MSTSLEEAIHRMRTVGQQLRQLRPIDRPPPVGWTRGLPQAIDAQVDALVAAGAIVLAEHLDPHYCGRLAVDQAERAGDAWLAIDTAANAFSTDDFKLTLKKIEAQATKARKALLDLVFSLEEHRLPLSSFSALDVQNVVASVRSGGTGSWQMDTSAGGAINHLHRLSDTFNGLQHLQNQIEAARRSIDYKIIGQRYAFTFSMGDSFLLLTGETPTTTADGRFERWVRAGWEDAFGVPDEDDDFDIGNIVRRLRPCAGWPEK